jgi:hypothetical protein
MDQILLHVGHRVGKSGLTNNVEHSVCFIAIEYPGPQLGQQ